MKKKNFLKYSYVYKIERKTLHFSNDLLIYHPAIISFDSNWKNFVFIALDDHQMLKRV